MTALFNHQYRIPSARLQHWNYANAAMYFVTICTQNKAPYFGEIVSESTPDVETQCIASLLLMPDVQTQCIASLPLTPDVQTQCIASLPPTHDVRTPVPILQPTEIGKIAHAEWYKAIALRPDMNLELGEFVVMPNHIHGIIIIAANEYNTSREIIEYKNQFAPQSKNLSSIIRGYKSAVTTYARKNNIAFDWQPRFHDHVIRSIEEYHRISNYIITNPAKWQADKFCTVQS
jgi:putative transposase